MALLPAPLWAQILLIGGCAAFVVLLVAPCVLRPTVLQVDRHGVWIRRSWLRPRRTESYPWSAIETLVTWSARRSVRSLGVEIRDGVTPLVRPPRAASRRLLASEAPGIPPHIAVTSLSIFARLLDMSRLVAAVDHFAPGVAVVDVSARRVLHRARPA